MSAPELSAAEAATVARFEAGDAAPESWTGSQVAVDLRMAADVLERDGWTQGVSRDKHGCRCLTGALATAVSSEAKNHAGLLTADYYDRYAMAAPVVRAHLGTDYLADWNDEEGRTADEVIAALRAAADKADQA